MALSKFIVEDSLGLFLRVNGIACVLFQGGVSLVNCRRRWVIFFQGEMQCWTFDPQGYCIRASISKKMPWSSGFYLVLMLGLLDPSTLPSIASFFSPEQKVAGILPWRCLQVAASHLFYSDALMHRFRGQSKHIPEEMGIRWGYGIHFEGRRLISIPSASRRQRESRYVGAASHSGIRL